MRFPWRKQANRSIVTVERQEWPRFVRLGRRLGNSLMPGFVGAVLTMALLQLGVGAAITREVHGALFRWRGVQPWDDRLVLVNIDQASLEQLGWFPWPRDRYAQLLSQFSMAGDNVVAFNLIFSESSSEDMAFAEAMKRHGQVVLSRAWALDGEAWNPNPTLAEAASTVGDITRLNDRADIAIQPVFLQVQDQPRLAVATLQAYGMVQEAVTLPALDQPVYLNWPGPIAKLVQYSFVDVLTGQVSPEAFKDKIVLIGFTAQGLDSLLIPFNEGKEANSVYLHAALMHTLLQENALGVLPLQLKVVLGILVGPIWGAWLLHFSRLRQQLGAGVGVIGLWVGGCGLAFIGANFLLPVAWPLLMLGSTGITAFLLSHFQLERQNQALSHQANFDAVTQIQNRSYFEQQLPLLWQGCLQRHEPLALILCDIDHFKAYNDVYGHPAGDSCLREVAQGIQSALSRSTDWVARYGGEEFVILLPNTDLEAAVLMAQRIQASLKGLYLPHSGSLVDGFVTVSLGIVSAVPNPVMSQQLLVNEADKALYLAKQQGRNGYVALPCPG